ncbi:hypothetical protein [Pseudactinotalea suaedae]|uniref:hypothetical protein n=1 Tax=Pseudactinotalea suaedae TaxID=1524924 RepID=UPI0012E0F50F|nr:hypothetical protein [Pseudactinotalea suaedae]
MSEPVRLVVGSSVGLPARRGVGLLRVLRSEWVKAWTVPATFWCVGATMVLHAAVGLWVGYNAEAAAAGGLSYLLTIGLAGSQVPLLMLGVITAAGEHQDGSARATYVAVPRRLPVLVATAVTVATIAVLAAVFALATTWLALLAFRDRPGVVLAAPDGDLGRVVLGTVLYLVTVTLLALAIGAALRRPAAATVVAITLLLVLEQALTMMGTSAATTVRSVLPGWAGRLAATPTQSLRLAEQAGAQPGPWQGYGILVAWTLAALLVAALVVRRRDV